MKEGGVVLRPMTVQAVYLPAIGEIVTDSPSEEIRTGNPLLRDIKNPEFIIQAIPT